MTIADVRMTTRASSAPAPARGRTTAPASEEDSPGAGAVGAAWCYSTSMDCASRAAIVFSWPDSSASSRVPSPDAAVPKPSEMSL
jgi:hypothetical protein